MCRARIAFLGELRRLLRIPAGGDTDADGIATVEAVGCLGCCTLAPVIRVDERIIGPCAGRLRCRPSSTGSKPVHADRHGRIAAARAVSPATTDDLESPTPRPEIRVGVGSCCVAGGSRDVLESLEREVAAQRLDVTIKPVGCVGICHLTPLVEVVTPGAEPIVATRATPADVPKHPPAHCPGLRTGLDVGGTAWRIPGGAMTWPESVGLARVRSVRMSDVRVRRFTDPQVRIVTEHSGLIDPTSLEEYRARDGFVGLGASVCADRSPHSIIETIERSGLRGRGGGGYPTAAKWRRSAGRRETNFLSATATKAIPVRSWIA